MRTVPYFVPEVSEKFCVASHKTLKLNWILGAGRGNRTPMELLPTDFESAASASKFIYINNIKTMYLIMCKKM